MRFYRKLSFLLLVILLGNIAGGVLLLPRKASALIVEDPVVAAELAAINVLTTEIMANTTVLATTAAPAEVSTNVRAWADWGVYITETTIKYTAYVAYVQLLNILTEKIIAWINGEDGSRQKLLDWQSTLEDVADQAGGAFLNELAGMNLCNFSPNLNIPALLREPSFRAQAQCSFTDIQLALTNVKSEIQTGDWTNWIRLGQAPQNNPYALILMAQEQKLNEETARKEAAKNEGLSGGGFLAVRKCTDLNGQDVTASVGDMTREQVRDSQYTCEVVTPSGLVQGIANKAALAQFDQLNNSVSSLVSNLGTAGPFVVAIGNALINRIVNFGFTKAVSAINPDPNSLEGQRFYGPPRSSLDYYNATNPSYSYFLTCDPTTDSSCDQSMPGVLDGLGLLGVYNNQTQATQARSRATVDLQNYLAKIRQLVDLSTGVLYLARSKQQQLANAAGALTGTDEPTLSAKTCATNGLTIISQKIDFYLTELDNSQVLFALLDGDLSYQLKTTPVTVDANGISGIQLLDDPALDTDGNGTPDAQPDLTELEYVESINANRLTEASTLFDFYNGKLIGSPNAYDAAIQNPVANACSVNP